MLPVVTACQAAEMPDHTLQLDLRVTAAGSPPAYQIWLQDPNDPNAADLVNHIGDLDFSRAGKAVGVAMNLQDSSGLHLQFANNDKYLVFSFAKEYKGGVKSLITRKHYQIRDVVVSPDGLTVTFCYRNTKNDDDDPHAHHSRSRYGINLIDPATGGIYPIDPGVGNGSNK